VSKNKNKIVKKLAKKKKKLSKSCQKVVKKLSKSCQKVVPCIIGHFMCHGKPLKEKINKGGGWVGGVGWVGGQIVVPRPSASALLTGRRQKDFPH
jgi:hypothetical protein